MKQKLLIISILIVAFLFAWRHFIPKPAPQIQHKYFGVNIAGPEFEEARYPSQTYQGYRYFKEHGLTLIRIPFTWERLQPHPDTELNQAELDKLKGMIASAQQAGTHVIIEPHNFGKYYKQQMTTHDIAKFADLWERIAETLNDTPGIWGYELMNEPHDMPGGCSDWKELSQAAINAIRQHDQRHPILIPGYSWQSAVDWQQQSSCLVELTDPQNKLIYSAHIYFDADKSGKYLSTCHDRTIGVRRARPFLIWLEENKRIGMFTEYGVPPDTCWMETLDNFLRHIYNHPNIIGGIYWAAGPFWGEYKLSVEPKDDNARPQMHILQNYPTK